MWKVWHECWYWVELGRRSLEWSDCSNEVWTVMLKSWPLRSIWVSVHTDLVKIYSAYSGGFSDIFWRGWICPYWLLTGVSSLSSSGCPSGVNSFLGEASMCAAPKIQLKINGVHVKLFTYLSETFKCISFFWQKVNVLYW